MFNSVEVKNQKPLSAKIYLNLNFRGWVGEGEGGAVFWGSQNSKCRVLAKFTFGGSGGILGKSKLKKCISGNICLNLNFQRGYSEEVKTQKPLSAKICVNLNWGGGGGGILGMSKLQKCISAKIYLNLNFWRGGGILRKSKLT